MDLRAVDNFLGLRERGRDFYMDAQIEKYTSLVYPSLSSKVALCFIPPSGSPEHRFCSIAGLERFIGYAGFKNAKGWGIYITPSVMKDYGRNRRKESFLDSQSIIYLDCDQKECLDHIKERYPYPTLVAKTSKGRYQVYWRLDNPVTIEQQESLMSSMAIDIGADRAATDVSRVLRLPSFWNRKQGREPNTVDIVFTRDHAVPYDALAHRMDIVPLEAHRSPVRGNKGFGGGKGRKEASGHSEGEHSQSERDWYEVHRRLAMEYEPQEVVEWLENHRRDKRDPRYYAEYTVSKAIEERTQQARGRG